MNREEREEYGLEGEYKFAEYLESKDIKFIHNLVGGDVTPYDNMKNGDFIIKDDYMDTKVDVKRSFRIFESSIDNFKGDYYVLIPDELGIENGWVIKHATIKAYWKRMKYHNSPCIGTTWDDRQQKNVKYMTVNETLKKRDSVKDWIKSYFKK